MSKSYRSELQMRGADSGTQAVLGAIGKRVPAFFLWTVVFLEALDIAALTGPLLRPMGQAFAAVSDRDLAWVFTISVFFIILFTPIASRLADFVDPRLILGASLVLSALGSLVAGLAGEWVWVIVGRALTGAGIGAFLPLVTVMAAQGRTQESQSRFLGGVGASFGLAFLFGSPLSAALAARGQWRVVFLFAAVFALVLAAFVPFLPRTGESERPKTRIPKGAFDISGLVLFGLGLGGVSVGISEWDITRGLPGIIAWETGGAVILGLAFIVLWLFRERRATFPFWNPGLNKRPLVVLYVKAGLTGFWESCLGFLPLAAGSLLGLTGAGISGIVLTPVLVVMGIASPVWARVLPRMGHERLWFWGTLICLGGSILAAFGKLVPLAFWIGLPLVGMGIAAMIGAPLRWGIWKAADPAQAGTAQGVMNIALNIGQVIGGAAWGAWTGSFPRLAAGPVGAFGTMAGLAAIAFLVAVLARFRKA